MCGIVGLITDERHNAKDAADRVLFLHQALIIDTLRGDDAAGAFGCTRGVSALPAFAKGTGTGYALLQSKGWQDYFGGDKISNFKYAVGHNRAATQGGNGVEVAHPFQVEDITLVHNGTLSSTYSLPVTQHDAGTLNDSHTIAHNLAKHDTIEVLEAINGAFALVWHDARDDSLNIARNSERPLTLAKAAKHDTLYFASEGWMLYGLDERIGIGLQQIITLNPYYWLKFLPENGIKPKIRQFSKFEPSKMRKRPMITNITPPGGWTMGSHSDVPSSADIDPPSGTTIVPQHPKMEKITKKKDSKIAEAQQLDLMNYNIDCDQEMDFRPEMGEEVSPRMGERFPTYTVTGHLRRDRQSKADILAVVYGIGEPIWQNACNRYWTIRPIGIKRTAENTPIIICSYRTSLTKDSAVEYTNTSTPTIKAGKIKEPALPKQPETKAKLYPGPHGSFLRYGEWKEAVAKGCVSCDRALSITDADTITWVNERADPWCKHCQEDFNLHNVSSGSKETH